MDELINIPFVQKNISNHNYTRKHHSLICSVQKTETLQKLRNQRRTTMIGRATLSRLVPKFRRNWKPDEHIAEETFEMAKCKCYTLAQELLNGLNFSKVLCFTLFVLQFIFEH